MLTRIQKKKNVKNKKFRHPKWHDLSCEDAYRKVAVSARLLKNSPKNSLLGARLRQDMKEYKKLLKIRNKQFVENMFFELDSMENKNPRDIWN